MRGYYKNKREDIAKIIFKSPITKDGYFYCEKFRKLNLDTGDFLEKGYIYDRISFANKLCFTNEDIKAYLEKECDFHDIYSMRKKDDYLYEVLEKNIGETKLDEVIDEYGNTYEDLIDTCIYIINNK